MKNKSIPNKRHKKIIIILLIVITTPLLTANAMKQTIPNIQQITKRLKKLQNIDTNQTIREKLTLTRQGLKIEPNNPILLYQQALVFFNINRYQLSFNITKKLINQTNKNDPEYSKYLKLYKLAKYNLEKTKQTNIALTASLNKNPQDTETRLKLIKNEIMLNDYKKALSITKQGLTINPNNEDLLYQQTIIHLDLEQYAQAKKIQKKLSATKSGKKKAEFFSAIIESGLQKKSHDTQTATLTQTKKTHTTFVTPYIPQTTDEKNNFITLESYPSHVDDLNQLWFYNYLTYGHKTNFATYLLGIDHAYRENKNAFKYRAEMYPRISKNVYLHLLYAHANTDLFAHHDALLRSHFLLPHRWEITIGGRYYRITDKNLWSYSIWASKFIKKHWIALQPNFYKSKYTGTSIYLTGIYRYYFEEPNYFFSLSVGKGKTPDLLNLDAQGLEIIRAWHVFASCQKPVSKTIFILFGGGYTKEKYPSGSIRRKISALIGIKKVF